MSNDDNPIAPPETHSFSYPFLSPAPPFVTDISAAPATAPTTIESGTRIEKCGKCSLPVNAHGTAFFVLACSHYMHVPCFARHFRGKRSTLEPEKMGGQVHCARCIETSQDTDVPSMYIDRDAVITGLRNKMVREFNISLPRDIHEAAELSDEDIAKLLGKKSMFSFSFGSSSEQYECLRDMSGDEWVEKLLHDGRTFDAIFGNSGTKLTLHTLYSIGIKEFRQLSELGFSLEKHVGSAWKGVSPLWLVHELYNVTDQQLLRECSPVSLMEQKCRAEELWLCGVSFADLISRNVEKAHIFAWGVEPQVLVKYFQMGRAQLHALGITRADFNQHVHWRGKRNNDWVKKIYKHLQ